MKERIVKERRSSRGRHVLLIVTLALVVGMLGFACGSNDDAPSPICGGVDCDAGEGGSDGATLDGSGVDDARADSVLGDAARDGDADAGIDGAACVLSSADAGDGGTLQWSLNFGLTGYTYPTSVATDPGNGDIVVAGYFWGTTDFGGGVLSSVAPLDGSGSDVFVARFDKNGAYKWAGAWGNGSTTGANTIAVGPKGEMVFGGILRQGSLDFGCGPLTSSGSPDMFLVGLDKAGTCVWSQRYGVAGQAQGVDTVAIDGLGNVVFAGATTGGLDLGGGALKGFVLAKLSTLGVHGWSKAFDATSGSGGPWMALDAQGGIVLAGSFSKSIDLGGGALTTAGAATGDTTNAAFAARFDSSGAHVWSHKYGEGIAAKNVSVSGVAIDKCGGIVLHGPFAGTVDFGTGPETAVDTSKSYVFLAKLSSTGTGVWTDVVVGSNGGNAPAFGLGGVAVGATGASTIAPRLMGGVGFESTADFGGGALTGIGKGSVAIATADATGKYRWQYGGGAPSTATSSAGAFPTSVATFGGSVVVTGSFNKCNSVCATAPPGTTLVLAGKTLTAVSGQDLFLASFTH